MVTQWMILLSVASLALGATLRDGGEKEGQFSIPVKCCDYEKVLPKILTTDKLKCGGAIEKLLNSKDSNGDGKTKCSVDCALGERGLLNGDKSVKEPELKKMLMEQTDPDAKTVLEDALGDCFMDQDNDSVKDATCPSGADDLFRCIVQSVASGCPDKLWLAGEEHCEASKDKYWRATLANVAS